MFKRLVSQATQATVPGLRGLFTFVVAAAVASSTLVGITAASTPANATVIAPTAVAKAAKPVVVPGKDRITATWPAVTGATKYLVRASTSKSLKKAKSVTTTRTTAVVSKLKKSKTYYLRVTAYTRSGASTSPLAKAKTTTKTTGRGVITSVRPAGVNTITVNWKRFPRATSIAILISWDNTPLVANQKSRYVRFSGYPATATSAKVKIPSKYLSLIGSTTGNPAYVRLISYNGPKSRTSKVAYGWPSALPASGTQLNVATFNVTTVTARPSAYRWMSKRNAVANSIRLATPDVLMVQEAGVSPIATGSAIRQINDLSNLLANSGLSPAYPLSRLDALRETTARTTASFSNHVFVRTSKLEVVSSGLVASSQLVTGTNWSKVENRYFAWAKLRVRATGQYLWVASVHLLGENQVAGNYTLPRNLAKAMNAYIAARNSEGSPVIIGGDFNEGFNGPYNLGPADTLRSLGYLDAASANKRSNARYSTSNSGFPSRPKSYAYVGTRIDYLMVKNTGGAGPVSHVNQMVRNSNGTFASSYYGSDHNLQRAVISLGQTKR